jgi:hypothetical protein
MSNVRRRGLPHWTIPSPFAQNLGDRPEVRDRKIKNLERLSEQ